MTWASNKAPLALALILAGCAGCPINAVTERPVAANTFCLTYHRVVRTEDDGASLAGANRGVRDRILGNELAYRCECDGWSDPVCSNASP